MWQCSQQHENRDAAKFCSKCGEVGATPVKCSQCGSALEPEDLFCTSCGHRLDPEPAALASAVPEAAVATAALEVPKPDEPVTFSFGGTIVTMKDDLAKPDKAAKVSASGGKMSSAQSAILSFVLIAVVLGLAFYLITR